MIVFTNIYYYYCISERNNVDKDAHQAQVLWAACQSLYRAVKSGCPGFPWTEQLRPLDPEIKAVKLAAGIQNATHLVNLNTPIFVPQIKTMN